MIDLSFLEKITGGDTLKIKKYISMYLSTAPEIYERMNKNVDQENWSDLALNVHFIKPQTGFMGIKSLKHLLIEIEQSINDGQYGLTKNLYQKAFEIHEESQFLLLKKLNEL